MTSHAGRTANEAQRLAAAVREVHPAGVTVDAEGGFFVVLVETDAGRWTLYDQEDWQAWQPRINREYVPSSCHRPPAGSWQLAAGSTDVQGPRPRATALPGG